MNALEQLSEEEREAAVRAVTAVRVKRLQEALHADTFYVYGAMQPMDLTEGRGGSVPRGWFALEAEALRASQMLDGVMGTENTSGVSRIKVYLTVEQWINEEQSVKKHIRARK